MTEESEIELWDVFKLSLSSAWFVLGAYTLMGRLAAVSNVFHLSVIFLAVE